MLNKFPKGSSLFIILIICLSILVNSNILSQTLTKINYPDNHLTTFNQLLGWIKIKTGDVYFVGMEDSIKKRIVVNLRDNGFYFPTQPKVVVSKTDSTNFTLDINFDEGFSSIINNIKVINSISDSSFIDKKLNTIVGTTLTKENLNYLFDEILTFYENNGYPFSLIHVENISFEPDSVQKTNFANLLISIYKNEKCLINKIEIVGNTKTKDYVIIRATGINIGNSYSQKIIDDIPSKLNRLRFFDRVEIPSFYLNSKKEGVLKITVKEKETNSFDGIAGYVPPSGNIKGYFTGFININFKNLFGTGRSALVKWQQENKNSQELELKYSEPWIFSFPFNIEGGLFQRKQDTTYVQRNFNFKIEYMATDDIFTSVIFDWQSTIPTEGSSNIFTIYNSSTFSSGFILKNDTRDDIYSPTKGLYFSTTYKFSKKNINGPSKFIAEGFQTKYNQQKIEFDLATFWELFSKQVVSISLHGRELRGSNLEVSDLYFLGGTNSLRGYREKQFQGNRTFWSNLEYRYLLSQRTYTFLFLDTGYFLRNEDLEKNIDRISEFKYGYGFGLNIETGLGILGISFALGKGDSFTDGKIHFGIINEF